MTFEDSLGTVLKLLIYAEGAMIVVWFGIMFLVNFIETLCSIGPASESIVEKRFMIGRLIRTIFDIIFVIAAAAVVLYIHIYY